MLSPIGNLQEGAIPRLYLCKRCYAAPCRLVPAPRECVTTVACKVNLTRFVRFWSNSDALMLGLNLGLT